MRPRRRRWSLLGTLPPAMPAPESVPRLVERDGAQAGRTHDVPYGEHVVGRGTDVSVQLEDADVSRHHLKLTVNERGILLEDLGSKNGVFVDGERIEAPRTLLHGHAFVVGGVTLEVDHAPSRVQQVLTAAGEPTVTRVARSQPEPVANEPGPNLLWPLIGVVLFAVLAGLAFVL